VRYGLVYADFPGDTTRITASESLVLSLELMYTNSILAPTLQRTVNLSASYLGIHLPFLVESEIALDEYAMHIVEALAYAGNAIYTGSGNTYSFVEANFLHVLQQLYALTFDTSSSKLVFTF
jgi:hypothetical protein